LVKKYEDHENVHEAIEQSFAKYYAKNFSDVLKRLKARVSHAIFRRRKSSLWSIANPATRVPKGCIKIVNTRRLLAPLAIGHTHGRSLPVTLVSPAMRTRKTIMPLPSAGNVTILV
jgi:hypothetical protein